MEVGGRVGSFVELETIGAPEQFVDGHHSSLTGVMDRRVKVDWGSRVFRGIIRWLYWRSLIECIYGIMMLQSPDHSVAIGHS